jgi:NAD(P)-dependent dehydrogenase (short-subunit alcohol dehydrogenase family)
VSQAKQVRLLHYPAALADEWRPHSLRSGVMGPPDHLLTKQGYDLQFGTNVIGHYLFTLLLLPALQRSTAATGVKARVNHTSSAGHTLAPASGVVWDSLKAGPARDAVVKGWGKLAATWKLYGQSKMASRSSSGQHVAVDWARIDTLLPHVCRATC